MLPDQIVIKLSKTSFRIMTNYSEENLKEISLVKEKTIQASIRTIIAMVWNVSN